MLNFNPSKRPSAVKCLQHSFFQCNDVLKFYGFKINKEDDSNNDINGERNKKNINFAMSMNSNNNFMNLNNDDNNNLGGGNISEPNLIGNDNLYNSEIINNNSNNGHLYSNNKFKGGKIKFEDLLE